MTVFYLCPDSADPCGGARTMYRHVEILNRNRIRAILVHTQPGFRCKWFQSNAPVISIGELRLRSGEDFLVIPEVHGPNADAIAPGIRKVIFNQGAYNTFNGYSLDPSAMRTPYQHPDFVAILVVSEDSRRYLTYAFPHLPVFRVYHSIDGSFSQSPHFKRRRIVYMPRKNLKDVVQVINLLKFRGALTTWELIPLDGLSENDFAQHLRDATVFLNFSIHEGFCLPPAEAMANGCIVIGYDGFGGQEYMLPDLTFPIPAGNVMAFAGIVENVLQAFDTGPESLRQMAQQASRFIVNTYSKAKAEQSLLTTWQSVLFRK